MVVTEKQLLRKQLLAQTNMLAESYIKSSNHKITKRLLRLPEVKAANIIFCYVSVNNEVDTHEFIKAMLSQGKRVCIPFCLANGKMMAREITSLENLKLTSKGLYEPDIQAPLVAPDSLDLIVVPCIACDKNGVRLGYGGGYYDRYLPQAASPLVCLCRGKLLQQYLPSQEHDRYMPCIITEKRVLFP